MTETEETIRLLRDIGLSELEAKCLLALAEGGRQTGYEVAKMTGVSRSNVYAALQNLTEEGLVLLTKGEPALYAAARLQDIRSLKEHSLKRSLDALEDLFPERQQELHDFYSIEGDKSVLERIELEIVRAEREIMADLWSDEAILLGDLLQQAEREHGKHVALSVIGEPGLELKHLFAHGREEAWQKTAGRKFSLVFDRRIAILGVRGAGIRTKAVCTEHPALVSLLMNNFFHDYVLHEIGRDFGPQLEERYGKNFEQLYRRLTGRGWGTHS